MHYTSFFCFSDSKSLNPLCLSFSVYTNSRRLVTYTPVRGALESVDGIRAISMAWIIIGHTFAGFPPLVNNLDYFQVIGYLLYHSLSLICLLN